MKKQSDALSKAWETIKAPLVAANSAMNETQKKQQKEQEMLARAVKRNARERQARHIAKSMPTKLGHSKEGIMSHNRGHSKPHSSVISKQEKQALHRNISHLMDDLPKKGPVKGIKITKKTVSVKPISKTTKVKKPAVVCKSGSATPSKIQDIDHTQRLKIASLVVRKYAEKKNYK